MRRRPSARLLVIDPEGRVLLFRFTFSRGALAGQTYWATPGGAVEQGETFEEAALRELREETGIVTDRISRHVGEREFELQLPSGERVLAQERFFFVHAATTDIRRDGWSTHEIEVMTDHKWWSADELARTTEAVWPEDLAELLKAAAT